MTNPPAPPSAAPLDLDALLSEFHKEVALEALESVANPRVDVARAKIIEAFAAARRGGADTALLDSLDALEDARLMVRDSDSGEENTLWWRMPTHLRERGCRNPLNGPIREVLAARALPPEAP